MKQAPLMVETLKRYLKHKGITYAALARELGQSESNVKRLFSKGTFSLRVMEAVCEVAGLELLELARLSRREQEPEQQCFTKAQEAALAADRKLFALTYLLLSGVKVSKIAARYDYEPDELQRYLLALDRLGVLELDAGNRVRLLISKNIHWLPTGPLKKLYNAQIAHEFTSSDFGGLHERMRFLNGLLTKASIQALSRRLDRLIAEFVELAEIDKSAPSEEVHHIWLMLAYRPWRFTAVSQLRKR